MTLIQNSTDFNKLKPLIEGICNHSDLYLFGGAVRDDIYSEGTITPKDFDFVYVGDKSIIENITEPFYIKHNMFGGRKLSYKGLDIDIWHLEDSFYLKNSIEYSIDSLLQTTYSSLESVVFHVNRNKVIGSDYFWENYHNDTIQLINLENVKSVKAAVKAIKMSLKFHKCFNDESSSYLNDFFKSISSDELDRIWQKIFSQEKDLSFSTKAKALSSIRYKNIKPFIEEYLDSNLLVENSNYCDFHHDNSSFT